MSRSFAAVLIISALFITTFTGCPTSPTPASTTAPTTQINSDSPFNTAIDQRIPGAGHLTADQSYINFGVVEPATKLKHTFTVTNDGDDDVTIANYSKSCTCTVGTIKIPTTLKPGESTTLEIEYLVPTTPGISQQRVTLTSRPPATPRELTLSFLVQVKEIIRARPNKLNLEIRPDQPAEHSFIVESTDQSTFGIEAYTCSGEALQLNFEKGVQAAQHQVTVSNVDFNSLRRTPSGYVLLNVSHPKITDIIVPFQAVPPFMAYPATVIMRNIQPGIPMSATVKVVTNFNENFQLGQITSKNNLVKAAKTTPIPNGYNIELQMTLPPDTTTTVNPDQITIPIVNHPDDNITINCYGYKKSN